MRTRLVPIRQIMSTLTPGGSNGGRSPLGTPFFHIFRRATKDMAAGGTGSNEKNQVSKNAKRKDIAAGGTGSLEKNQLRKHVIQKDITAEGTGNLKKNQARKSVKSPPFSYRFYMLSQY